MARKLHLTIVTPEREVYNGPADEVVLPAHEGYMGILPDHLPVVALTKPGMVECKHQGSSLRFFLSSGYFELHDNKIVLLVRSSEPVSEIDVKRAREALERAEKKLKEEMGITEAERMLLVRAASRAQARIDLTEKMGG